MVYEKQTKEQIEAALPGFTGTMQHHKLTFMPLLATDGIAYLAEAAGAFWLVDAIASHQPNVLRRGGQRLRDFQIWTLKRNAKGGARLECKDDEPGKVIARQDIKYTDFPLDEIKLYVESGVLLLPGEH